MALNPSSPITGSAQTGFTSPTYTFVADTAPNINGKQIAVTALGGTQTGVDVGSVSKPFTVTAFRPAQLKVLPAANPITGVIKNIPNNVWKILTRKGMVPAVNQPAMVGSMQSIITVPAGADTHEPEEIRAMISAHIGYLNQLSAALGDTVISGII